MKPLIMADIVSNAAYMQEREGFRRRIIAMKKYRRVDLGDRVTVVFENPDTMRFQIQEMLRIENISDPVAIQQEIDTYNDLLPSGPAVGATLLIAVAQDDDVAKILRSLSGIEETVSLHIGEKIIPAGAEPGRSRPDTTSTVHYLRFTFEAADRERMANAPKVELSISHPNYPQRVSLAPSTVAALVHDIFFI